MKYLMVLSGLLLPFTFATTAFAQPYPKPVVDELLRGCTSGAPTGTASAAVTTQCQCVVSAIQSRVSLADYTDLDTALKAQKPLSDKQNATLNALVQSGQSCAKPGAR
jgi:hypothetical protein